MQPLSGTGDEQPSIASPCLAVCSDHLARKAAYRLAFETAGRKIEGQLEKQVSAH